MKRYGSADESRKEEPAEERLDRPTVPVARPSPIRIQLIEVAYGSARVDIVVADLARDPRSEYCFERSSGPALVKTDVDVPRIAPLRAPSFRKRRA